jgi:hypothetical protein
MHCLVTAYFFFVPLCALRACASVLYTSGCFVARERIPEVLCIAVLMNARAFFDCVDISQSPHDKVCRLLDFHAQRAGIFLFLFFLLLIASYFFIFLLYFLPHFYCSFHSTSPLR